MTKTLEATDLERNIRRAIITLSVPFNVTIISLAIDTFLIPRPWWKVLREPFDWDPDTREIILERYPSEWDPFWSYLAAVNFPNSKTCSNSSILVGRSSCVHPGWFSVLSFYRITQAQHPYAVKTVFFPMFNDSEHENQNAWITDSDCPSTVTNRWNCAFLPTTNCTTPAIVTDCTNKTCKREHNAGFSLLLNRADATGEVVPKDLVKFFGRVPGGKLPPNTSESLPSAYGTLPYDTSYVEQHAKKRDLLNIVDLSNAAYSHLFLVRKTAFYRSKIAALIHKFRNGSHPHFPASAACVAVQIRRGDRAIPGHIDPVEWCYNASHKLPCNGGHCVGDFGCSERGGIPFAAINLSHVIEKVPVLVGPDVKNIVVASDDPDWVHRQIAAVKKTDPSWNFYTLPHPELPPDVKLSVKEEYRYLRSAAGTQSGVFLFASIELARQCSGFIAHLGAGGAMIYQQYLCLGHAGLTGVCPPTYDFRQGLWLRDNNS